MPKNTPQRIARAGAEVAPRALSRHVAQLLFAAWTALCITTLLALIGARWLRYTTWSSVPWINDGLRKAMLIDAQAFLWPWVYTTLKLPILVVGLLLVVACLHRRLLDQVVSRVDGRWRLRRTPIALLLGTMVWFHYAFDVNPTIASLCATSLALAWIAEHPRIETPGRETAFLLLWIAFFSAWVVAAGDPIERFTIAAWAGILLASHRYIRPRTGRRDLLLLRVLIVIPMNLLPATLPLLLPLHGGRHLGEGLAYSFCEVPNRGTVYATIPVCDSVQAGYHDCKDGRVVEYDLESLDLVATHRFFSPNFHGRLEYMVCLEEEVQVSVQASVYEGRPLVQSAMSFRVDDPRDFIPVIAGPGVGIAIAYDEANDALFYTSEFTNALVRYDRQTHQFDDSASPYLVNPWFQPVSLEGHSGSAHLYTGSIHPVRNRIYLGEWMHGRYAYAIDLTTNRPVVRYDVASGAALGIAVDPERDRLYVSSLWGIEVFDLATDQLIVRKRTGLGNRPVVIDRERNRLYLSSMVEGKIRILDRDTLDVVGQIPIGIGSRFPLLSRDGRQLFASSTAAHYAWELESLAPDAAGAASSPPS